MLQPSVTTPAYAASYVPATATLPQYVLPHVHTHNMHHLQAVKRLVATTAWRTAVKPQSVVCNACKIDPRGACRQTDNHLEQPSTTLPQPITCTSLATATCSAP